MPMIQYQSNSDDEFEQLYRKSLTKPRLLAEIQHHCDLLGKAIDESVSRFNEAEQQEFQLMRTIQREPGHDYADLAEVTGSPHQKLAALNLQYHLKILLN